MPTSLARDQADVAPPVLLVDYENIQDLGLLKKLLPTEFEVRVFVGANQAKIPTEVVKHAQKFGPRLTWIQIDGHGKNALDFHIAYTVGLLSQRTRSGEFQSSPMTGVSTPCSAILKSVAPRASGSPLLTI